MVIGNAARTRQLARNQDFTKGVALIKKLKLFCFKMDPAWSPLIAGGNEEDPRNFLTQFRRNLPRFLSHLKKLINLLRLQSYLKI